MRLRGLGINSHEIDGARASRSGADMRQLLAEKRIDEAGFANIRTAQKGEFRRTFWGEEFRVGCRGKEFGDDGFHEGHNQCSEREEIAKVFAADLCRSRRSCRESRMNTNQEIWSMVD